MIDRKWWPEYLLDESMPMGRESPSAWIRGPAGETYALDGYEDDLPLDELHLIAPGGTMNFAWSEDRGEVEITVNADGTFITHGPIPPDATHFWLPFDTDTMADSMEQFAMDFADNANLAGDPLPGIISVGMYVWSEDIPHKLIVDAAGPRFEPTHLPDGETR